MLDNAIRHISLDVWSTLIEPNPEFKKSRTKLYLDFFDVRMEDENASTVLSETAALVNQLNSVSGKCMDRSEVILLALRSCGKDIAQYNEEVLAIFFQRMDELFLKFPPFLSHPDLPEAIERKAGECTFSILSNTLYIPGRMLSNFLHRESIGRFMSFELYSDEINSSKPSRAAFDLVGKKTFELHQKSPQEILHIGDNSINDVAGAEAVGMKALLVTEEKPLITFFAA